MINVVTPRLIILNFDDNQKMLQGMSSVMMEKRTPVLCLLNRPQKFHWGRYSIVFTQDLEQTLKNDRLSLLINSILMLQNESRNTGQAKLFEDRSAMKLPSDRSIPSYGLELEQKVEVLKKVKSLIKDLYREVDDPVKNRLLSIANLIKASISDNKHWEDFKLQFNNSYKGFLRTLNAKHPNLTQRDIKYCCYLKIGMTNEDIRHILGINQESVSTHKYRLKRKLQLDKHQNLRRYITKLSDTSVIY